jgi:hypothetical protein
MLVLRNQLLKEEQYLRINRHSHSAERESMLISTGCHSP